MNVSNTIGIWKVDNNIGNAGVGFVVIPENANVDAYIQDCYRTNTLTIWGGRGYGYFSDIHVDEQVMQQIKFPENPEEYNRGSAVVWIKDDNSQLPVVIASIRSQEDFFPQQPNQYQIKKNIDDKRTVELLMDANTASIILNIVGDSEESGDLNIKVTSDNKDSVINVNSDNKINICGNKVNVVGTDSVEVRVNKDGLTKTSIACAVDNGVSAEIQKKIGISITDDDGEEKASVAYEYETGFTYKDEFDNEITCSDGEIDIKVSEDKAEFKYKKNDGFKYSDQFNNEIVCKNGEVDITSQTIKQNGNVQHNSGTEPMVKGQTLMSWLNNLCTALMAITVPTAVGPSGVPVNAPQFGALQAQLNNILSQKSKLE